MKREKRSETDIDLCKYKHKVMKRNKKQRNGCWDMPISTNSNETETKSSETETKSDKTE